MEVDNNLEECKIYKGLRIYKNGQVERKFKRLGWKIVPNNDNHDGYNQVRVCGKLCQRHRLIVAAFNPDFDIAILANLVDHIDGVPLNNNYDNLRVVSAQGNNFNRRAKGYTWNKRSKKWQVRIKRDGKSYHIGLFTDEEKAREAYLQAKEKYHIITPLC